MNSNNRSDIDSATKKPKIKGHGIIDGVNVEVKAVLIIDKLAEKRGWRQNDVAEATGIAQGQISRLPSNERFEGAQLVLLSKAFGVPIDGLFEVTITPVKE